MRLIEIIGILLFYLFLFGGCAAMAITITPSTLIATLIIGALCQATTRKLHRRQLEIPM